MIGLDGNRPKNRRIASTIIPVNVGVFWAANDGKVLCVNVREVLESIGIDNKSKLAARFMNYLALRFQDYKYVHLPFSLYLSRNDVGSSAGQILLRQSMLRGGATAGSVVSLTGGLWDNTGHGIDGLSCALTFDILDLIDRQQRTIHNGAFLRIFDLASAGHINIQQLDYIDTLRRVDSLRAKLMESDALGDDVGQTVDDIERFICSFMNKWVENLFR